MDAQPQLRTLSGIMLVLLLLAGCNSSTPSVLVSDILAEPPAAGPGAEVHFSVSATGPELTFAWSTTAGSFLQQPPTGPSVVFKAPDTPQVVTVSVIVKGAGGQMVTKTINYTVGGLTSLPGPTTPPVLAATATPTATPTSSSPPMATPTATPAITRTAWIDYPSAKIRVAQFTTVTGGYAPQLTDDLWVFVQDQSQRYFPASMFLHLSAGDDCGVEGVIQRGGKWEMPVILGNANSVGQAFRIILATASPAASQSISDTQRTFCLSNSFPGLLKLPTGITVAQELLVVRGPDIGGPLPPLDANLSATGSATLTNVVDQGRIAQTTWITGTQTGTIDYLWVLVYVYNGRWYPQSILPCIGDHIRREDTAWWTRAGFGGAQDRGRPFDIVVVQANSDANQAFEDVQAKGCNDKYFQGLRTLQLPPGIAVLSQYRVYRQ